MVEYQVVSFINCEQKTLTFSENEGMMARTMYENECKRMVDRNDTVKLIRIQTVLDTSFLD